MPQAQNTDDTDPNLVNLRARLLMIEATTAEGLKGARHVQEAAAANVALWERVTLAATELAQDMQPPQPNGNAAHDDIPTAEERGRA